MVVLNESSKTEVPGCQVVVEDRRLDKRVKIPPGGTTYSYPIEYPIPDALRNNLCRSDLSSRDLTVYLEHAKCEFQGGFGRHQAEIKASVKGYTTPAVSTRDDDAYTMIGKACGHNLDLAIGDVVQQIQEIVSDA